MACPIHSTTNELGRQQQEVIYCGNSCCNSLVVNTYIFDLVFSKKPRGFPLFVICFEASFVVCSLPAASELCWFEIHIESVTLCVPA